MKKLTTKAMLAAVMVLIAAVSGCGENEKETRKSEDFRFGEDELTFSWYNNSDVAASTPWADTSLLEKWVKDNKKVTVKYMDPGGASAEKLATMIVSDEFPDVMTMLRGQDTDRLISAGKVVPLNDYMEKYTYMSGKLNEKGILNMMKYADGKNYEIPNWANIGDSPNGNNGWVINTKYYEELGSPKLESFDDLYRYLKMVKEKYPNVVPYETTDTFQGERYVMAGMAEDFPPDHLDYFSYPENGKLKSVFKHPAYKETMIYLNKLYSEGLMTQDVFSQTSDQVKEKLSTGKVAVISSAIGVCEDTREELKKTGGDWISIKPLMKEGLSREKVYSQGYDRLGWTELLITKDAENPEGIYAYFDWLFSPEGQRLFCYGPKGIYYDDVTPEGYPILNEKWYSADEPMKELMGNGSGVGLGNTWMDGCGIYVDQHSPEDKRSWGKKQQLTNIWPYAKDITEYSNIIPGSSTDEGIIYQTIKDLHKEARAKMIFAASSQEVEEILNQLINDTDKAGMDKLLAAEEKVWKENKEKLAE
ncbi:MAG: extracellular solute-binding protein [Clostridia bacterium]|nr:extracellular solute-binding protein [Clostridia bacterium]